MILNTNSSRTGAPAEIALTSQFPPRDSLVLTTLVWLLLFAACVAVLVGYRGIALFFFVATIIAAVWNEFRPREDR
ncbi:MAG: hypothetical protein ABW003_26865 [Microvirga sp.]